MRVTPAGAMSLGLEPAPGWSDGALREGTAGQCPWPSAGWEACPLCEPASASSTLLPRAGAARCPCPVAAWTQQAQSLREGAAHGSEVCPPPPTGGSRVVGPG